MKKRSQSYSAKLKPVVLYFDDLEKIVEILKEISNDVEISTKEYQFENIEEVKVLSWCRVYTIGRPPQFYFVRLENSLEG